MSNTTKTNNKANRTTVKTVSSKNTNKGAKTMTKKTGKTIKVASVVDTKALTKAVTAKKKTAKAKKPLTKAEILARNQKATEKKATSACVYEFSDGTSKILNKRYFDVTTDKGNTYKCIVDMSMASNLPVYPIEVPQTGLAPQKGNSVIFCPKSKSKWGILKAEEFVDTKGIISASNKARRGKKWEEHIESVLNATRIVVDKTTGAKSEALRYFALDKGNKAHALIIEYTRDTLNKWEVLNDIQKSKALKAKNAERISA